MYKYVLCAFLITFSLYGDADFCEEDQSCDSEEKVCPYCRRNHSLDENYMGDYEDGIDNVNTWPSRNDDPFMQALSR